jgi:hypothetical protein
MTRSALDGVDLFDQHSFAPERDSNMLNNLRPEAHPVRTDTSPHAFKVGQAVRVRSEYLQRFQKVEIYRIVGKLPPLGESPQYRIRSEGEPYERVVTQDKLEPEAPSAAGDQTSAAAKIFSDA